MYGILGEDESDVQTLKVLIRRLRDDPKLPLKLKGYDGCGEMLRKGERQLHLFAGLGCDRFVICYDADGHDPNDRREEVMRKIVRPSGFARQCCVLVPVQELEAWILADIEAVSNVLTSWRPDPIKQNPEAIKDPKEYLERLSRGTNKKPIYSHATHNPRVAQYLRLALVRGRCPSFEPLVSFVANN